MIQGIVTGIGFLGAGVIIKEGFSVRGLTTAASIWVVAAIGVTFGAGLFTIGAAATIGTWLALQLLRRLEARIPVHSLVHCELDFARGLSWNENAKARVENRFHEASVRIPASGSSAASKRPPWRLAGTLQQEICHS